MCDAREIQNADLWPKGRTRPGGGGRAYERIEGIYGREKEK
jgi:hypothetical protein